MWTARSQMDQAMHMTITHTPITLTKIQYYYSLQWKIIKKITLQNGIEKNALDVNTAQTTLYNVAILCYKNMYMWEH